MLENMGPMGLIVHLLPLAALNVAGSGREAVGRGAMVAATSSVAVLVALAAKEGGGGFVVIVGKTVLLARNVVQDVPVASRQCSISPRPS